MDLHALAAKEENIGSSGEVPAFPQHIVEIDDEWLEFLLLVNEN